MVNPCAFPVNENRGSLEIDFLFEGPSLSGLSLKGDIRSGRGSFSDLTPADVGGPVHADSLPGGPGLRSGVELLRGEAISDFRGGAGFWGQGGRYLSQNSQTPPHFRGLSFYCSYF